jgi:o-succinylbenzoate synthase
VKVSIEPVSARLRAPFVSAAGSTTLRRLLVLRLEDSEGHVGLGESAPLESYDGVRLEDCRSALEHCRELLTASDGLDHAALLAECARVAVLPQASAAVDSALWDLAGRRKDEPVWRLLGAEDPPSVEVNHTIAAGDRAGAVAGALAAREAGVRVVKVKVGTGDDAGRVAALRAAAGRDMAIRLDANGAWSVPEALAALRALEPAGIELCEEPVHGLDQLSELSSQTHVRLAMDESTAKPGALDRRVCAAVSLKLSRCGGITGLINVARRARAVGYEVYLSSTLDGPIGIAAALHAAAVIVPDRACGLATLPLFETSPEALAPARGRLSAPPGVGLGDGLAEWYGRA